MDSDIVYIPDIVYVFDKNEQLIAVFNKEDEDTLINPRVSEKQNAEAIFTFSISPKNEKWKQINNPENLYRVNNKIFSANFEGCFEENITDNNEDVINVTAYERQKLLSRKFVRAWNSTTGFAAIDTFMVVILSNGILRLVNNGEQVNSIHPMGTSGYVLDGLLYGTGWTTGTCDIEEIYDFETDQINIYDNILKVQEIWGGILVFDSVNKIIHHRDETKFLPYNGYEVKYEKNMQSLDKIYNNKIITKLCPLGEGGLNIKSINDGSEWLTNFDYTDTVLEDIVNNPDIYEPEQLKKWGERKLQELSKPRKELTVDVVLLHQLEGYELETIGLNDIVDVINYQYNDNDIEQLRAVSYEYSIWDNSDAVLELSDITLDSTDIFKKNVTATNAINNGTLNSEKIVIMEKNGQSLNNIILNIDETVIQTKADFEILENQIELSVEEITTNVDNLNNEIVSQQRSLADLLLTVNDITLTLKEYSSNMEERISQLQQTVNSLNYFVSKVGGDNLIKNSAMMNGTNFWLNSLQRAYTESDTLPIEPQNGDYWYCTSDYINYVANTMYVYEDGTWVESSVSRKTLDIYSNLLENTSSSEYFQDGQFAANKTISGRVIKLELGDITIDEETGYANVKHIFNATDIIPINQNEEYLMLSYYLKNSIKTGNIVIGLKFANLEQLTSREFVSAIYEPQMVFTPDDIQDLTKIDFLIKIPKKEDFIPVVVSANAPEDITKNWLDTTIYMPKQYNEETEEWEIMQTNMSLYDEDTKYVWAYRASYGFYYTSNIDYDTLEIKSVFPEFSFYPSVSVVTSEEEPIPQKGMYWGDSSQNKVYRAKYNNTGFVEWEDINLTLNQAPPGAILGLPSVFEHIIPCSGFFELSDIKLEYNTISTLWTQYPGETYSKNYKADEKGLSIQSGQNEMFIDEDEIVASWLGTNIFVINKDLAYFKKIKTNEINLGQYVLTKREIKGEEYLILY